VNHVKVNEIKPIALLTHLRLGASGVWRKIEGEVPLQKLGGLAMGRQDLIQWTPYPYAICPTARMTAAYY